MFVVNSEYRRNDDELNDETLFETVICAQEFLMEMDEINNNNKDSWVHIVEYSSGKRDPAVGR